MRTADAQADLSLRWHMPFHWFCHEAAHFVFALQAWRPDTLYVGSKHEVKSNVFILS